MTQLKFQYVSSRVIPVLLSQLSSFSFRILAVRLLGNQLTTSVIKTCAFLASVYKVVISVDYCDMVNASYSYIWRQLFLCTLDLGWPINVR